MKKKLLLLIFTLSSILSFGQNSQENKIEYKIVNKSNYSLVGRRVQFTPKIDNDCNSIGKVVLEVTVDRDGKTISANLGKGTTADSCLIEFTKKLALEIKWQPSETAAEKQVGTITYNFTN